MSLIQRWLARLYGTSENEQDERTRQVAQAIRHRAEERQRELGERDETYSRAVSDAYTRRGGR